MEKLCVSDYFSNVKYQDLCATINPSKIWLATLLEHVNLRIFKVNQKIILKFKCVLYLCLKVERKSLGNSY